jgi:putative hydroxymethylpyrimidine transporter CytX
LVVTLIANPIAYLILALVGYMGYKVGTTSMGLTRASFGIKGSILPSVLNVTQFVGWCAVNTFIAAISMSFLFNQAFGWPAFGKDGARWVLAVGILVNSVLQIWLTVVGGSRSIKLGERMAVLFLVVLTAWETVVIFQQWDLQRLMNWSPPAALAMPFGKAVDAMAAFSLAWVPAIAEFTRYTRTKSAATVAPMIGANVSLFWFAIVGTLGVIAVTLATGKYDPNMSDPSTIIGQLGLGWVAFLVLLLATVTTNVVNIYAAGMSLANICPRLRPLPAFWAVAVLATAVSFVPLFMGTFLGAFISFLDYVGFIFAPLFSIMLVDFYVFRRQNYDWSQADKEGGAYWYRGGVNWYTVGVWTAGALFFLGMENNRWALETVGAVYPTMVFSAVVYYLVGKFAIARGEYKDLAPRQAGARM